MYAKKTVRILELGKDDAHMESILHPVGKIGTIDGYGLTTQQAGFYSGGIYLHSAVGAPEFSYFSEVRVEVLPDSLENIVLGYN